MNKKEKGKYIYPKQNDSIFLEGGRYRLHLTGVYNPEEGKDKFIFLAAKALWLTNFKKDFIAVLKYMIEQNRLFIKSDGKEWMQMPMFSLYDKEKEDIL